MTTALAHGPVPAMSRIGSVVGGKYRLDRLLGEGGMGAVYAATNTWTERRVALKLMTGALSSNPEAVHRFFREAKASTRIGHPNVIEVLDLGQDPQDGSFFLVMELLDGTDLRQQLDTQGVLSPEEAVTLLAPVMSALIAAHRRGIVHRDLKPENILLARRQGQEVLPKVIDFGIARIEEPGAGHTRTGAVMGTPAYMSPEQAAGEGNVDAQSDVWAMGVVLYECLSGRLPYDGANFHQVLAAILTREPIPLRTQAPAVPARLGAVVHRALQRDRTRRYATMAAFLEALLDCKDFDTVPGFDTLRTTLRGDLASTPWVPSSGEEFEEEPTVVMPEPAAGMPPGYVPVPSRTMSQQTVSPVGRSVARAKSSSSVRWATAGAGVLVLGAIAIASGMGTRASTHTHTSRAGEPTLVSGRGAAPSQERFRVEVRVEPGGASLELDGIAVTGSVLIRELPRDGREHLLRARAPGYVEQVVSFADSPPPSTLVLVSSGTLPLGSATAVGDASTALPAGSGGEAGIVATGRRPTAATAPQTAPRAGATAPARGPVVVPAFAPPAASRVPASPTAAPTRNAPTRGNSDPYASSYE